MLISGQCVGSFLDWCVVLHTWYTTVVPFAYWDIWRTQGPPFVGTLIYKPWFHRLRPPYVEDTPFPSLQSSTHHPWSLASLTSRRGVNTQASVTSVFSCLALDTSNVNLKFQPAASRMSLFQIPTGPIRDLRGASVSAHSCCLEMDCRILRLLVRFSSAMVCSRYIYWGVYSWKWMFRFKSPQRQWSHMIIY